MRPRLKGLHVDIRLFIEHYGGGSWHQGDLQRQSAWLKQHEALWEPVENNNAKIFICAHTDFKQAVWNDVYEVIDSREIGEGDVPSLFYSELWQMMSVSKRKKLPRYIGFVQCSTGNISALWTRCRHSPNSLTSAEPSPPSPSTWA